MRPITKILRLSALALFLVLPAQAWPMGGFEYYDQTPERAWKKTMQALTSAAGPVYGLSDPGRGAGAEEHSKRYVTRWYTMVLPPGWAAQPRKPDYTSVTFYPKDKRLDILFEVNCLDTGMDMDSFTARFVKWSKATGGSGYATFVCRENTLQHNLPCSIVTTYVDIANKRLFQVMKVMVRGNRTYTVKCITDSATWVANFDDFRKTLDSFTPEDCSVKPCVRPVAAR
ncbi:MAG: hypothetical protein HZA22_12110 [Nitrospirae bacterium]|nr:hypothetical protein [Nitrospirota bacterium]